MATCPQCGQENPNGFKFCGACGAALEVATSPREVRKTVTVVFSDVTGSTRLGEQLDPESLRRVMGRYFDEMQAVVESHEGTVEKFIGDAVMAVFGIPVLHEDDALRAVRAATEMRERLSTLNEELERDWGVRIEVRTGVNTGEVVAGDASSGQRFATGDAVNVAKRFEEAAPPGEILLGEPTYRLVRDAVDVEAVAPLQLKGKGDPVPAYRLLAIEPGAEGRVRRLDSPMVGRDRERALLERAYERAVGESACHLFTILGAAGVGKSRLVTEFLDVVHDQAVVVSGRCLPYGEGITFWPLLEIVRALYGEDFVSTIGSHLAGDENADVVAARVGGALGLVETTGPAEETFWAFRKLFEAKARERPLVVVFDDLQWAEPTFLDLVEHIADWAHDAPILLACLARPELLDERPGWGGGKFNATSVLLERLSDDESAQLVQNLLGQARLSEEVRVRVTEAAEGNPLFAEEMLRMLIDDGLLRRSNGDWVPTGDLEAVSVPPTIHALLSARLDRLGSHERAVIERGSVEGKVFHRGAVAELSPPGDRPDVANHLQALVRKELVRPDHAAFIGEDAFRFRHLLIRDAAYESMPKEVRADLHERFADWLEQTAGDQGVEYEEILGYHLEQAHRYRTELAPVDQAGATLAVRAAERLGPAGRRALRRGDWSAGAKLMLRAGALLPEADARRARLLADAGVALIESGEMEQADRVLSETIESARKAADRSSELRAILQQGYLHTLTDPDSSEDFRRTVEAAIPELETLGDESLLAKGWAMMAHVQLLALQVAGMQDSLERSLEFARRSDDREQEVESLRWLLRLQWFGPNSVREGIRFSEETLELARGDPGLEAVVLATIGVLEAMRGDFDRSRDLLARAGAMQIDLGMVVAGAAGTSMMRGAAELLAGNPQAAEDAYRSGFDMLHEIGEKAYLSTLAGYLAQAVYEQGRYDDAERLAEITRSEGAIEDLESQRLWLEIKGKVLARRGDLAGGEALVREGVAIIDRTDAHISRAEARLALAEVLRLSGRPREAADFVREAAELYERKGVVPAVDKAKTLLAELEAESSSA
jgi:class 3 adenylate cyclase/tetratricopeptide (TPR) repeat protein